MPAAKSAEPCFICTTSHTVYARAFSNRTETLGHKPHKSLLASDSNDERQNVLGMDKEPIPGLYATGNCCGRRWGVQYSTPIPGVSIGMAWTLGRLCGMHAAEDIPQEEA